MPGKQPPEYIEKLPNFSCLIYFTRWLIDTSGSPRLSNEIPKDPISRACGEILSGMLIIRAVG